MTVTKNREEHWNEQYEILLEFVKQNRRAPSRHRIEEHKMLNWLKFNRKVRNKGCMPLTRITKFTILTNLITSFNRVNQYK